jgi:hypothetical protein
MEQMATAVLNNDIDEELLQMEAGEALAFESYYDSYELALRADKFGF